MKTLHVFSLAVGLALGAGLVTALDTIGTAHAAPTYPDTGSGTTYSAARDGGIVVRGSTLVCNTATETATGCIIRGAQAFQGPKSFNQATTFFGDGGTWPVLVKAGQGASTSATRGVCLAEDGTAASCSAGMLYAPSSGYMTLAATYLVPPYIDSSSTIATTGLITTSRSSSPAMLLSGTGYLQITGVATGSLPTCNSAAKGALSYDTTTNKHVGCNGTAWQNLY